MKKIILIALFVLLAIPANAAAIDYNFGIVAEIYYDNLFSEDAYSENADLAFVSSALAQAAYDQGFIESSLYELGAKDIEQAHYDSGEQSSFGWGYAAVTIGWKQITVSGKQKDLFIIIIRGTEGKEWDSNFNLGSNWHHLGFDQARRCVDEAFSAYYENLKNAGKIDRDINNNILWITGHSRGAAAANLLASDYDNTQKYALKENIYTYTYACPNVTTRSVSDSKYRNIFNYINANDIVSRIPLDSWGYHRYGVTIDLTQYKNIVLTAYYGLTIHEIMEEVYMYLKQSYAKMTDRNSNISSLYTELSKADSDDIVGLLESIGYDEEAYQAFAEFLMSNGDVGKFEILIGAALTRPMKLIELVSLLKNEGIKSDVFHTHDDLAYVSYMSAYNLMKTLQNTQDVANGTSIAPDNPLIGIWTAEVFGITTSMEFRSDGVLILSTLGFSVQYQYSVNGNQIMLIMDDSYTGMGTMPMGTSTFTLSGDQLLIDGIVYTKFK